MKDAMICRQTETNCDLKNTDNAMISGVIQDNQYNHDLEDEYCLGKTDATFQR